MCVSWQDQIARASVKNMTDLFSSLIRISHMLVAERNFLPSCKLHLAGESLVLIICRKQRGEDFIWGYFLVSSQRHPYLLFLLMLPADTFLPTQFL